MELILKINNLFVNYGKIEALKDISFAINKKDVLMVTGGNATGKSTLLKSIIGLTKIKKGEIIFKGKKLNGFRTHQIIKKGISIVPENRRIFNDHTVEENLLLGGTVEKEKNVLKERKNKIYKDFSILAERKKSLGNQLSGGERQILSIARALMTAPELMLIDEPTAGLSQGNIDKIFEILEKLNNSGITMIIVEHKGVKNIPFANSLLELEAGEIKIFKKGKNI